VNLVVAGRRVVVVGGGRIGARKVAPLLDQGADVVVVDPEPADELVAAADQGRCALVLRPFEPADLDGAWLAVAATADPAVNAAVFAAAEDRRIWCNAADDPDHCSFTLMSVIRRSDLVLAVGTGGRSPALAAHLRGRLDAELGPEYATLLDLLSEAREAMRSEGRSSEDADWQRAFESGIVDLVRAGRLAEAKELLHSCL
jgi:siroheme synthase-like protein